MYDLILLVGLLSKKTITPVIVFAVVILVGLGLIFAQIKKVDSTGNFFAKEKWIFIAIDILAIFSIFVFVYLVLL